MTAPQAITGTFGGLLGGCVAALAARIGAAAGDARGGAYNPDHVWDFAIDRLIPVIEGLMASGLREPR